MRARYFVLGGFLCALAGCNVSSPDASGPCTPIDGAINQRGLVTLDSDYSSTNIALVSWNGQTQKSLFSSASSTTGLSAPLSGNVLIPRFTPPNGDVVILDDDSSVITWVSSTSCGVRAQASVGNFKALPHDYVEAAGRGFVSRYGENPDPNGALLDPGGDVLAIDPVTGARIGTIDLHSWVGVTVTNAEPFPDHMLVWHGMVLVLMQGFNPSYEDATDTNVAVIDPTSLSVVATQTLPGLKDCNAIAPLDQDRIVVVCSGLFKSFSLTSPPITPEQGAQTSGVAVLAPGVGIGLAVERIIRASDLLDQPLQFSVGVVDPTHVLVTTFGNTDAHQIDSLLELDLAAEMPLMGTFATSNSAFDFGDIVCLSGAGCVLADAQQDVGKGVLRRFFPIGSSTVTEGMQEVKSFTFTDPFGLPPRNLGLL